MPSRFDARVTRLEALSPQRADASPSWEVPPGYWEEVTRILWAYGQFPSVEVMLSEVFGLTDDASIAAVSDLLAGDTP